MRRTLVLAVVALVLVALGSVSSSGAPRPRIPTKQQLAQRILNSPAGRLMTPNVRLALSAISKGERRIAEASAIPGIVQAARSKTASGGRARNAMTPSALSNVRVNDPSKDDNQVDQTTQSETSIAVAGSNVAVGYNDSQQGLLFTTAGASLSGYSYSSDGGAHFTDGGALPNTPEFVNLGDPWLTSDRTGNMYYGTLAFDFVNFNVDVAVAKSTDGGKTWSEPVPVYRPPFEIFYIGDKDALTAGPDPSTPSRDNVYAAYDDFSFDPSECGGTVECVDKAGLPVARSTDSGTTWELHYADRVPAFGPGCSFRQFIGAQPIVDPSSGTLYVSAEKLSVDDPDCSEELPELKRAEVIYRSTDGGQTFNKGVKIADVTASVPDVVPFGNALKLGPGMYMRNLEFPTMAHFGNALYVAWNDGQSGRSHIRLAKSTDGGQSWSTKFITSGTGDELQPALSDDGSGLHVLYYQRNADNTLDVVVADSSDGENFTPLLVTTESFPGVLTVPQFDPIIAFAYMGDYISNVSDGTNLYFAWGDNRDIVTNFMYPQGRHDPDVFFAKQ